MLRWCIALGLLAGVTAVSDAAADPAAASPRPAMRDASAQRTTSAGPRATSRVPSTSKTKATSTARAKAKAKAAKRAHRGRGSRAHGSNMPRGFTWPPSRAMARAEAACQRTLDAANIAWRPASPEGRIAAAVTIDDGMLGGISYVSVYRKGPQKLDCQLAKALHAIGPALHAAGVREVRFGSMYRWSNVRVGGKTKNALSRHALGLAIDVVAFVDENGRAASVARDYPDGDPLLLAVERAIDSSSLFRLVLTPSNDPVSHHDHFHIEANPSYASPTRRGRSS